MTKLQLKKEVIQNLDASKLLGGGDTITGDSGGTNCNSCRLPCPTRYICPTDIPRSCDTNCGGGGIDTNTSGFASCINYSDKCQIGQWSLDSCIHTC